MALLLNGCIDAGQTLALLLNVGLTVLAADTTDVCSAAKAADGGSCPAIGPLFKRRREGPWAHAPLDWGKKALGRWPWALDP